MGWFDRKKDASVQQEGLSETEGLVAVALLASYADGVLSADEWDDLARHVTRLPAFAALDDRAVRDALVRAEELSRKVGEGALLAAAAQAVPERLHATAYFLAADLVCSDGDVGEQEQAFLERFRDSLDVAPDTARKILDVIAIKNRA